MKNKKSMEVSPMNLVIGAAILGLVLVVIVFGVFPIFTKQQVPSIKAQNEYVTEDCDEDGAFGPNDQCPCVTSKQKLEKGQKCGPSDKGKAQTNCPNLCKIT